MDVGSSLNVLFSFNPKLGHFIAKVSFIPIMQLDSLFWRTHFNGRTGDDWDWSRGLFTHPARP